MLLKKYHISLLFALIVNISYSFSQDIDSLNKDNIKRKANIYYNLGIDFGSTGQLDSALFYTEKATLLLESISKIDNTLLANTYQSLGIISKLLGKYDEAINYYEKAEQIYTSNNNIPLLAYIYGNKANIYFIQQDYAKAYDYHSRALDIFRENQEKYIKQLALTYNNIGNIFRKKEDYINAIKYYEHAVDIINKKDGISAALGNMALCFNNIKKYDKAQTYYLKAINAVENELGNNNIKAAIIYLNYANFLSHQHDDNQALKYFYLANSIYINNFGNKHPFLANSLNDLGEHYLRHNALDSALFYFQQSLVALSTDFNDTSVKSNPDINNVLSKTHLLRTLKNKANALSMLATNNNDINNYKLSLNTYDLAIEAIRKIRSGYISEDSKLYLADNEFETFSEALQTSFKLYQLTNNKVYTEKIFNYSEAGKSAILTESLKNNQALNIGGIPDSLLNKEKQLEKNIWNYEELIYEENKKKNPDQNKLGYWNTYLFEEKQKYDDLIQYMDKNFHKYHELKHEKQELTLDKVRRKLKSNEVIIEYFYAKSKIYSIIISNKKTEVFKLDINQKFQQSLENLLSALSNNNFSNHGFNEFTQYHKSSYNIYSALFKPIENIIENKNLVIIPDGKLAYLPFEVLTTDSTQFNKINYKGLPYFLYQHHFSYSYSASFLFENAVKRKIALKTIGAFAPSYNSSNDFPSEFTSLRQEYRERLFPLKGIKVEVQEISRLLNGDKFLDTNATEKIFKKVAPNYDILHLAMHTIMDDKNPMYSKMAFTQSYDSIEDGFLNTFELYNMKLNSRMAVLSSCNSGSGKLQRGEGVMSLARGFIYSGCPSIVMTLWSVEDKSGVKLMISFYENLLKGRSKSESLQLSKIKFIEGSDQLKAHPYFWSGYVVIGNNDPLFKSNLKPIIIGIISVLLFTLVGIIIKRRNKKKLLQVL